MRHPREKLEVLGGADRDGPAATLRIQRAGTTITLVLAAETADWLALELIRKADGARAFAGLSGFDASKRPCEVVWRPGLLARHGAPVEKTRCDFNSGHSGRHRFAGWYPEVDRHEPHVRRRVGSAAAGEKPQARCACAWQQTCETQVQAIRACRGHQLWPDRELIDVGPPNAIAEFVEVPVGRCKPFCVLPSDVLSGTCAFCGQACSVGEATRIVPYLYTPDEVGKPDDDEEPPTGCPATDWRA